MTSLSATARAVLALLNHGHPDAALTLLRDGCKRGLPMAAALNLLAGDREPDAREMLEGWADA